MKSQRGKIRINMEQNNHSDSNTTFFWVGQKFQTFDFLREAISSYEKNQFCNLKICNSRSIENAKRRFDTMFNPKIVYYEIKYTCFFSNQRKYHGVGKRNKMSLKTNCPFQMSIRASKDGACLEVRSLNLSHNHDCDPIIYQHLPPQRKIDLSDETLSNLIAIGANKKLIQAQINKATGKNISLKSLHNVKKEIQ